ncbi:hypothetical protein [Parabacteroides goldsteinii]|uniref:hypothetical protein n=1 Tax=Parabacteroides goldsteinii TaxID=328812 RepID=UPI003F73E8AD
MINASGFLLRLLVDSRYRIFRHFLLFFLSMLIISVNFYLDLIEGKESLIRSSIAQSLILLIPIYLSVFILTPRLLLKNKLGKYVISVFLVIAVAILFSYLLRQEDIEREYKLYQFWVAAFCFPGLREIRPAYRRTGECDDAVGTGTVEEPDKPAFPVQYAE